MVRCRDNDDFGVPRDDGVMGGRGRGGANEPTRAAYFLVVSSTRLRADSAILLLRCACRPALFLHSVSVFDSISDLLIF